VTSIACRGVIDKSFDAPDGLRIARTEGNIGAVTKVERGPTPNGNPASRCLLQLLMHDLSAISRVNRLSARFVRCRLSLRSRSHPRALSGPGGALAGGSVPRHLFACHARRAFLWLELLSASLHYQPRRVPTSTLVRAWWSIVGPSVTHIAGGLYCEERASAPCIGSMDGSAVHSPLTSGWVAVSRPPVGASDQLRRVFPPVAQVFQHRITGGFGLIERLER